MVSACAYSGAYPTGYGRYGMNTEGVPARDVRPAAGARGSRTSSSPAPARSASTTTTSGSRRWSSRSTRSTTPWALHDETAEPGYYAATLELGHPLRAHRRRRSRPSTATRSRATATPGSSSTSRCGGLAIDHGRTVPLRAHAREPRRPAARRARSWSRACRWRCTSRCDAPALAADALVRPPADRGRHPARVRPHPADHAAPVRPAVHGPDRRRARRSSCGMGFSLRGVRAGPGQPATRDCGAEPPAFDAAPGADPRPLARPPRPDRGRGRRRPTQRTVFATALYHSLIKPCFADDESPFWPTSGPFAFDICTMWDIYKTQLPLLTAIAPDRAVELLRVADLGSARRRATSRSATGWPAAPTASSGRAARSPTPFSRRRARARPPRPRLGAGRSCTCTTTCAASTARTSSRRASPTRSRHTLDLAYGYHCTAQVARARRRRRARRRPRRRWPPVGQRLRPGHRPAASTRSSTRAASGTTRSGCCTTWRRGSQLAGGDDAFVAHARPRSSASAPPGEAARPSRRSTRDGRRLRAQPVRGAQQRAGHGGALGLPLRRPPRPHRRGRARRADLAVRHRPRAACRATTTRAASAPGTCGPRSGLFPVAGQSLFLVNAPAFDRAAHPGRRRRVRHRDQRARRDPDRRRRHRRDPPSVRAVRDASTASRSTAPVTGRGAAPRRPPAPSSSARSRRAWGRDRPAAVPSDVRCTAEVLTSSRACYVPHDAAASSSSSGPTR